MDLFVCVRNGGIFFCRILQLEDAEWYSVDIEKYVGDAYITICPIADFKLVDRSECVLFWFVEVYKLYVESLAITVSGVTELVSYE